MEKDGDDMPKEINCYKIGKFLFSYSNYNVYTGINSLTKEEVTIKSINKKYIKGNEKLLTYVNNDILYTKLFTHNHILKLLETHETPLYIFIIMEKFKGEFLSTYMSKKKKLDESKALQIFSKVISVMLYIHNMNVCHLNINLESILIDEKDENLIKIYDFKYSKYYYAKFKTMNENVGINMFTSPEMFSIESYYPELADVWSCGILLYFLLTGDFPTNSNKELDIDERYIVPNDINEDLQDLLKNMLCIDVDKRYRFDDIVNSKYFTERNYNDEINENNNNFTLEESELRKIYERYLKARALLGKNDNKNDLINFEIIIHRELLPDDKRMSKLIEKFGKRNNDNNIIPKKNYAQKNTKKIKNISFPIKKKDTFTDFKFNKNKVKSDTFKTNNKKGVKGKRKSVFELYSKFPQKSFLFEIPENLISEKDEFKYNTNITNNNKNNYKKGEESIGKKNVKINTNNENNFKILNKPKISSSSVGKRRKTQFAFGDKYSDFNMFSQLAKKKKKFEEKKDVNVSKNELNNNTNINNNSINNDKININTSKNISNNMKINSNNNFTNINEVIKDENIKGKTLENNDNPKINDKPLFNFDELYEDVEVSDKEDEKNKIIEEKSEKENDKISENSKENESNEVDNSNIEKTNNDLNINIDKNRKHTNLNLDDDINENNRESQLILKNKKTKSKEITDNKSEEEVLNSKIFKNKNTDNIIKKNTNKKNNNENITINTKLNKEDFTINYDSKFSSNQNQTKNSNIDKNNYTTMINQKRVLFKATNNNEVEDGRTSPHFFSNNGKKAEEAQNDSYYTSNYFSKMNNDDSDDIQDKKVTDFPIFSQKNKKPPKIQTEKVIIKKFVSKAKTPDNKGILKKKTIFSKYKNSKNLNDRNIIDNKDASNNSSAIKFEVNNENKSDNNRKNSVYDAILKNLKDLNKSFEKNGEEDLYIKYMRRKITPDKFKNKKKIEKSSSYSNSKSSSEKCNGSIESKRSSESGSESRNTSHENNSNNYSNTIISEQSKQNSKNNDNNINIKNINIFNTQEVKKVKNDYIRNKIISKINNKTIKKNSITNSINDSNSSYYSNSLYNTKTKALTQSKKLSKYQNTNKMTNQTQTQNKDILKDVDNFNFLNNEYNNIKSQMNKNSKNNKTYKKMKINSKIFTMSNDEFGTNQNETEIELSTGGKNILNSSKEYLSKVKKNLREKLINVSCDLSEEKVQVFNGNVIDIKYISLKNYEQTVNILKKELKRKGVKYIRIDYNSYKCTKGIRQFYVDIVKIPRNIFYYRFYTKKKQINNFQRID